MLFLLPAVLLLAAFLVVPAAWSLAQSFTNFTLLGPEARNLHGVGLANYVRALYDPEFWNALRASLLYVFGSALIGQVGVGLALALLTSRLHDRAGAVVRALAIAAWIVPGVVVAILWHVYLQADDGTLNRVLAWVGMPAQNWLLDYPMLSLVIFNTWRGAAFSMLLLDGALRTVPPSYQEAAAVSGAPPLRQFLDVTLPLIRPQLITDILLISLWTLNDFGPYMLTGGGPGHQTEVLPIYTYRVAFRSFDLGYGAALSTMLLGVNLAIAVACQRMARQRA